ncbi:unnamed protein product [Toxocara canis]|uniref:Spliceosome-associated protein CWC15 homolog n=1 Tax=Toxocara canis TaxID=6265 RepID=A0A183TUV9_TOXCA|nr:unnamed protein product [Toxocara canis]
MSGEVPSAHRIDLDRRWRKSKLANKPQPSTARTIHPSFVITTAPSFILPNFTTPSAMPIFQTLTTISFPTVAMPTLPPLIIPPSVSSNFGTSKMLGKSRKFLRTGDSYEDEQSFTKPRNQRAEGSDETTESSGFNSFQADIDQREIDEFKERRRLHQEHEKERSRKEIGRLMVL